MNETGQRPTLQIYVASHCWTCDEATRLAREIRRRCRSVRVEIIDVDDEASRGMPARAVVPAYVLDGATISLGNPTLDELVARIDGVAQRTCRAADRPLQSTAESAGAVSFELMFGLDHVRDREFLIPFASVLEVGRGQALPDLQGHGDLLHLVVEGQIRLTSSESVRENRILDDLGPGSAFGDMAILGLHLDGATASALVSSVLWTFEHRDIERMLVSRPRLALRVLELVGRRAADLDREIDHVTRQARPAKPQA